MQEALDALLADVYLALAPTDHAHLRGCLFTILQLIEALPNARTGAVKGLQAAQNFLQACQLECPDLAAKAFIDPLVSHVASATENGNEYDESEPLEELWEAVTPDNVEGLGAALDVLTAAGECAEHLPSAGLARQCMVHPAILNLSAIYIV